jgi:hypothetical protein
MPNSRNKQSLDIQSLSVVSAILAGTFIRLVHPLSGLNPLNDGGLFFTMVQDLQNTPEILPHFTSYNQAGIPFAYPPLAFLLTQFIANLTHVPLIDLVRLLPPIISCLTIPAFYKLARRLLKTPGAAIFATFAFAFLPTAFDPLIVGAGLTRAPGLLFSLLTLAELHAFCKSSPTLRWWRLSIYACLTLLSHPGMTWFTAYSSLLMVIIYRPQKAQQRWTLLGSIAATGLLSAPWWGTLIARHGVGALLSPFQTEGFSAVAILTPFSLLFTNEPLVDFLAVFAFLGLIACLKSRRWHLPFWLGIVFIFEPRLGAAYAAVPTALLAGVGVRLCLLGSKQDQQPAGKYPAIQRLALGFLCLYGLVAAYLAPQYQRLSQEQFESMDWIQAQTPADATFIVLTGIDHYGVDYISEWFPSLAQRISIATPQGYEWLPNQQFNQRAALHAELQSYIEKDWNQIDAWASNNQVDYSHIYISKKDFSPPQNWSELSPRLELVFENEEALIFEMKP